MNLFPSVCPGHSILIGGGNTTLSPGTGYPLPVRFWPCGAANLTALFRGAWTCATTLSLGQRCAPTNRVRHWGRRPFSDRPGQARSVPPASRADLAALAGIRGGIDQRAARRLPVERCRN